MTATAPIIREHIEVVEGAGGPKARIIGSRIRVQDIVIWHEKLGEPVDTILDQFPGLTAADVHAALAYYWDHRDDVEQRIAEGEAFVSALRQSSPHTPHVAQQDPEHGESQATA